MIYIYNSSYILSEF